MISDEQREAIELLAPFFAPVDIAKILNLSYSSIYYNYKRYIERSDTPKPPSLVRQEQRDERSKKIATIVRMYMEGQNMSEIGRTLQLTRERIRQLLRLAGVKRHYIPPKKAMAPKFKPTSADRFWAKVDKTLGHGKNGDCWLWRGATNGENSTYGHIWFRGRYRQARQVAWLLVRRKEVKGCLVKTCETHLCINPDHMLEQTKEQAVFDKSPIYRRNKRIRNERQMAGIPGDTTSSSAQQVSQPGNDPKSL